MNTPATQTRCIFVRHGQTDWNIEQRLQGHTDIPLNAQGIAQAHQVAEHLSGTALDLVLSSDLSRARQTAMIIARHNCATPNVLTTDGLREMHVGELAGHTYDEIRRMPDADLWMSWRTPVDDPELWRLPWPGGESRADLSARATSALLACLETHAPSTLLIAAHGGTLKHLCHALFPEHDTGRLPNCAIIDATYDHGTWSYGGVQSLG